MEQWTLRQGPSLSTPSSSACLSAVPAFFPGLHSDFCHGPAVVYRDLSRTDIPGTSTEDTFYLCVFIDYLLTQEKQELYPALAL